MFQGPERSTSNPRKDEKKDETLQPLTGSEGLRSSSGRSAGAWLASEADSWQPIPNTAEYVQAHTKHRKVTIHRYGHQHLHDPSSMAASALPPQDARFGIFGGSTSGSPEHETRIRQPLHPLAALATRSNINGNKNETAARIRDGAC